MGWRYYEKNHKLDQPYLILAYVVIQIYVGAIRALGALDANYSCKGHEPVSAIEWGFIAN